MRHICFLFIVLLTLPAHSFMLESSDIAEGQLLSDAFVFNGFGCAGENLRPALAWKEVPEGTKSFAITVYDPDAPTGSGWWHWIAHDIKADMRVIAADTEANSFKQVTNDYGSVEFGGACPPPGEMHRYIFTIHALNVDILPLPEGYTPAVARFFIQHHSIASDSITAVYVR